MVQSMFKLNLANAFRYVHISVKFSKTSLDINISKIYYFYFGAAKEGNFRRCSRYRAELFSKRRRPHK